MLSMPDHITNACVNGMRQNEDTLGRGENAVAAYESKVGRGFARLTLGSSELVVGIDEDELWQNQDKVIVIR